MDANIKEIADKLAAAAIEKQALDMASLQKSVSDAMANPYVRNSLLGAGAGGLLGLASGGRRKWRDALHYALLGGLGGAGLTAGYDMMNSQPTPPPAPPVNPVGGALKTTGQFGLTAAAPVAALGAVGAAEKALPNVGKRIAARAPRLAGAAAGFGRNVANAAAKLPGAARIGRLSRWSVPAAAAYGTARATGLTDYLPGFLGGTSK